MLQACMLLLLSMVSHTQCQGPVNCRWGPYGEWSQCDGCTKTQVRTRSIEVFAQFGGLPCSGEASQRQNCVPTIKCPLELGCGDRFRCTSGKCISRSLVCNGDQDCEEDGLDERRCDEASSTFVCNEDKTPPHSEHSGLGYDVLTGQLRGPVINTKSFGGQCRKVFSGDHKSFYRLPQSILRYTFQVAAENDFSDEFYESSWDYVKHQEKRMTIQGGHDHSTHHYELKKNQAYHLLIIKNEVEVAQFQNNAPQYLPLSEEFWKALAALPTTYDPTAYRGLLERFGTHFMSEGSLGGEFQFLLEFDSASMREMSETDIDYHRCITRVKRFLFWKKRTTKCEKILQTLTSSSGSSSSRFPIKANIVGGQPAYITGLSHLNLDNPEANHQMYMKWAGSVKFFPQVIKKKLRPLYELVKEVQCAGVKRLHLKRAIEEYQDRLHPCHCQACRNNGQPQITGSQCACFCKPDTYGLGCEKGSVIGEQPGVIDGSWSCWSSWSTCAGGQRSRHRTCNNPPASNGGKSCIGKVTEQQTCEDPDVDYLRMMEPQCFDSSLTPVKSCKQPPTLPNGFVLNPKDVYAAGSKVEYSCIEGHYLSGEPVAQCLEDLSWKRRQMECKSKTTKCIISHEIEINHFLHQMTLKDFLVTYQIGDRVSLSCLAGMQRMGEPEVACSSSLNWYPPPDNVECKPMVRLQLPCRPWEKAGKGQCVCKLPYECESSFPVCASLRQNRVSRVGLCQIGALQCLGRSFALVNDSLCDWSKENVTSCASCQPWEKCKETKCVCREPEECPEVSGHLCVSLGDSSAPVTMSECEVGVWRCRGEPFVLQSVGECASS
uniref:Complement component C7 n=1 Tax=Denticeps clupeoides TaxID=299321 RepID=A0AAY4B3U6_9TELE